jgi:hypothetical protein
MNGVSLLPPLNFSRHDSIIAGKHRKKDAGLPALDSPWYLSTCYNIAETLCGIEPNQ